MTSIVVESRTPDTATTLFTGHLCLESVRTFQNIGVIEDRRQQSVIFKVNSSPKELQDQANHSKSDDCLNTTRNPNLVNPSHSNLTLLPQPINSIDRSIPKVVSSLNFSTVNIFMGSYSHYLTVP